MVTFASTGPGSRLVRALTPCDRYVLQRTGGRFTMLGPIGMPTLLLQTTGAKSGRTRVTPLLYARQGAGEEEALIVAGSNFGQQHHPAWTANLIKRPDAAVIMGGRTIPVRATLLSGAAAQEAYQAMIAIVPVYATYRLRTDRDIRVFRLARR